MDYRIDEKLAELGGLLKERADIEARIATFFGIDIGDENEGVEDEEAAPTVAVSPVSVARRGRRRKGAAPPIEPQTNGKRQRGVPCDECGSKGWRHYKGCSLDGASVRNSAAKDPEPSFNGRTILDDPEKISGPDWIEIKAAYEDGDSLDLLKLSYPSYDPMELRRSVKFATYEAYMAE